MYIYMSVYVFSYYYHYYCCLFYIAIIIGFSNHDYEVNQYPHDIGATISVLIFLLFLSLVTGSIVTPISIIGITTIYTRNPALFC